MHATRRSLASFAVVALLFAASGVAAWLGISQSPSLPGPLSRFLNDTRAEGTVAFTMTIRTAGLGTTDRISGVIDFADDDGSQVSETTAPDTLPQYTETVVVHGAAYERFAADRADGPHFAGPWQRLDAGISVPPFAPLAGPRPEAITPQHFVRLAQASVGGIATTMYQLASFGVACPPGTGVATVGHETTWLWVDGQGRVRRWENTSEVQFGSMTLRATAVVSFRDFGLPVSVRRPARAIGVATPTKPSNPYAGCLVTPG